MVTDKNVLNSLPLFPCKEDGSKFTEHEIKQLIELIRNSLENKGDFQDH